MNKRFFRPGAFRRPEPLRAGVAGLAAEEGAIAIEARQPMHDPPLDPRDEAVFLLTAAAEVEHALMAQYLYAAYSVRVPTEGNSDERKLQALLLQIAREEMGHLMTVQNVLLLIGGPLNFNREHSPYASDIYPFRFKLEPLTLHSLAKYVVAESPFPLPESFSVEDRLLYAEIEKQAQQSNDGRKVGHVGPIFARLKELFTAGEQSVKDEDFRLETAGFGGRESDWGFRPGKIPGEDDPLGEPLIVESFENQTIAEARTAALGAVTAIGEQGEGFDLPPHGPGEAESHFERFFLIYKRLKIILADPSRQPIWPVTENPNTTPEPEHAPGMMHMVEMVQEAHAAKGRIRNARARAWAQLFDLRYRMLLMFLSHFLRRNDPLYESAAGSKLGDRMPRGLLALWTFNEMRRLRRIAGKLVQLPKDDVPDSLHAGPPFGLPYTLNLPDHELSRWRAHLDGSRAAVRLIREKLLTDGSVDQTDPFLTDVVRLDEEMQVILRSLAAGGGIPEGSLPADFQKVVHSLEEAVRGFNVGPRGHANFWDMTTRDEFIQTPPPDGSAEHIIVAKAEGGFDADSSPLVQRLEGNEAGNQMPRFRPPVPPERTAFLRDWIGGGCPHNNLVGMQRERDPALEAAPVPPLPLPTTPLSFAADIQGLFRATPDRSSMLAIGGFDLHLYEDVRDRADRILATLEDGSMPCDGAWPPDRIAVFRQWIADGTLA